MKKEGFLKAYLITIIILAFLGLFHDLLGFFGVAYGLFTVLLSFLSLIFLLVNLLVLILFRYFQVEKIFYVFPIYFLVTGLLFWLLGFTFSVTNTPGIVTSLFNGLGVLLGFAEIVGSAYLLRSLSA